MRGLRSKVASLSSILGAEQPEVVVVCETHLKEGQTCKLAAYRSFYRGRKERHGGGLAVMVHHTVAHAAVLVYKGESEILVVRLSHTAKPVTIIAVYGAVNCKRDVSEQEWNEVVAQFRLGKARGDLVICTGDLNRKVGDIIPGNKAVVDYGGQLVRNEVELGEMVLVNAKVDLVSGGPMTWVRPGQVGLQQSALDLWLVCLDTAPLVTSLEIDDNNRITPFRVTKPAGRTKVTFADHHMTCMTIKNINREPKASKTKAWSWKDVDWPAYYWASREEADNLARKVRRILARNDERMVEDLDRAVRKSMKELAFGFFKKVTIRTGGRKTDPMARPDDEPQFILDRRKERFHAEMDRIAQEGAHIGQIYRLREIISGNKKKVQQVAAAIKDPDTG